MGQVKTVKLRYILSSTLATNEVQLGSCPTNNYNTGVLHRSHVLKLAAKKMNNRLRIFIFLYFFNPERLMRFPLKPSCGYQDEAWLWKITYRAIMHE